MEFKEKKFLIIFFNQRGSNIYIYWAFLILFLQYLLKVSVFYTFYKFYMKENVQNYPLKRLLLILYWLQLSNCLSILLNKNFSYTFKHGIIKAEVVNLEGTEFVFILFTNGTISKLDSQLRYKQRIIADNGENIVDFEVCNTNYLSKNTPSLIVTFQSRASWILISLLDSKLQYIETIFHGVLKVFCLGSYFGGNKDIKLFITVYYQDKMDQVWIQQPSKSIVNYVSYNLSEIAGSSSSQNSQIQQVIRIKFQGLIYEVSISKDGRLIVCYDIINRKIFKKYALSHPLVISEYFLFNQSVIIMKMNDSTYSIRDVINPANQHQGLLNLVQSGQLKAIRPKDTKDGDSIFIYSNKSTLIRKKDGIYHELNTIQSLDLADNTQLQFAVFNNGKGFAFWYGKPQIYSYCQKKQPDSCNLNDMQFPCSIYTSFCKDCIIDYCLQCQDGYQLYKYQCLKILFNCSISNCQKCIVDGTCLSYKYQLDQNKTSIISNKSSQDKKSQSNTTNATNQTNDPQSQNIQLLTPIPVFSRKSINNQMLSFDPSVQNMAFASTKMNSSPLLRLLLGFMSPLFSLFDDYWFYIYHENSWENLVLFPNFLVIMYTVNLQRIIPEYLRFTDDITVEYFNRLQQLRNFTHQRIIEIDQAAVYVAYNFQNIILRQFPFLILAMILIKLTTILIRRNTTNLKSTKNANINAKRVTPQTNDPPTIEKKKLNKKQTVKVSRDKRFIASITKFLEDMVSFRNIVLTFLGSNMIYISFQLSSQLRSFFCFNFIDKINMIVTITFGITFVSLFLILITLSEYLFPSIRISKTEKKIILQAKKREIRRLKYRDMNMIIFNGGKCILYGFIHGYFIGQNNLQYYLLIIVKILLIGIILIEKQIFQSRAISLVKLLYFSSGLLIDFMSYGLKSNNILQGLLEHKIYARYCLRNIIELFLMVILFGSIIFGVIIQLFHIFKVQFCAKRQKQRLSLEIRQSNILSVLNKVYSSNENQVKPINKPQVQRKPLIKFYKQPQKQGLSKDLGDDSYQENTANIIQNSRFVPNRQDVINQFYSRGYKIQKRSCFDQIQNLQKGNTLPKQSQTQNQFKRVKEKDQKQQKETIKLFSDFKFSQPQYQLKSVKQKIQIKKRKKYPKVDLKNSALKCYSSEESQKGAYF